MLNCASLSPTTSYATAGQCTTSVSDSYFPWDSDAAYRQSPTLSEEGHFVYEPLRTPIRSIPIFDGSSRMPFCTSYVRPRSVVNNLPVRPETNAVSSLSQLAAPNNVGSSTSVWPSNCLPVVCAPMSCVSQSKASVTSNGSFCSEVAFRIGDKGLFDTNNDSPLRSASQLTVVSQSPQLGRRTCDSSD